MANNKKQSGLGRTNPFPLSPIPLLFIALLSACTVGEDIDSLRKRTDGKNCTVTFNANGGEPAPELQIIKEGKKISPPVNMSKTGYIFDAWYKDSSFENWWDFSSNTVKGNISLYAKWDAVNYNIVYHANGGFGTMENSVHEYDTEKPLSVNSFTYLGYVFAGWSRDETGPVVFTDGESVINLASDDGAVIDLYALWGTYPYNVEYNANGGGGIMEFSVFTYGVPQALKNNAFDRTGYTFSGWAKTSDGDVEFEDGEIVSDLTSITEGTVELFAKWNANAYTIIYNNNASDAAGEMENSNHVYDEEKALASNGFSRAGYVFMGWNSEANGSGTDYADGENVINLSTKAEGIVTLYAKWGRTVTFNAAGGQPAPSDQIVVSGGKLIEPAAMTRSGFTFDGWYKESNFTTKWNFAADTVQGNITLYAKWGYTVTFNANSGAPAPAVQVVVSGGKAAEPAAMTRSGFTFDGWYKESNFITKWNFEEDTIGGNTILYAKWGYTVGFNANGGTPSPASLIIVSGGKAAEPDAMTKTGYNFAGWYRESNFASLWNFEENSVSGNITLYAKWDAITYTVVYNANGGNGNMLDSVHVYDVARVLNNNSFARAGYEFAGWSRTETGSVEFSNQQSVINLTTTDKNIITLYAQWGENPYYVSYNANGGLGNMTASTFFFNIPQHLSLNTFTRSGYSFAGWAKTDTGEVEFADGESVSDLTTVLGNTVPLYAKWAATVTYDKNNTDEDSTEADPSSKIIILPLNTAGSLPVPPSRTHYTFSGWNTNANGIGTAFTASTVVTGNITVYAQWTGIPYAVTFNKNNADAGSTEATPATRTIARPETNIGYLPTPPIRPHYTFVNWNTKEDGTGTAFTASTLVSGNITVYAQWTANTYTVTFNKNNSDTGSTDANPQTRSVTRPATTVNLPATEPSRAHYTFSGWNTQANGTGSAFTASTVVNGNITVYAQWTGIPYTVTFNKNNADTGSTEATPAARTIARPETNIGNLPTAPIRLHYTFVNWNTEADGSGTTFTAGTLVSGNITVYAQWTADTYTVTFNKNNTDTGSTDANPQTKTVTRPATTVTLPATEPTRPHYTFSGWNTQSDGNGTAFTASTVVTGNITVYAQWTGIPYTVTFNKNNTDTGSTEASPLTRTVTRPATTAALPAQPTRPHYTFSGWNTQANGSGTDFSASTVVTGNITVYAKWTAITYTVTFSKNNTDAGSIDASPAARNVTRPATTADLPASDPTRPHYTFINWNTEEDGSGTEFTASTIVTENITVYAQWSGLTYTVTFNKNNADTGSTEASPQTRAVTRPVTTAELPVNPSRPHYAFSSWNTKADGTGTAFNAGTIVTENITVYAQWTGLTYTVTFNKNNADAGSTEANPQARNITRPAATAVLPSNPGRPHYTFSGWNTKEDGSGTAFTASTTVTESITVYAQWSGNTYTVTFNKNNADTGSTEASPQTRTVTRPATAANLPTQPARTHYSFSGWNTKADGTGTAFNASTVVTENITVYAQWAGLTYTVTFNKNNSDAGSTDASPATRNVTYPLNTVSLPANPGRPLHAFSSWNTQTDGSGTEFTSSTVITGNITVYAQWSATVTYNKNNSDAGSTEASPAAKTITLPVTNVGSLPTPPTRPHYTFVNWNTKEDGTGTTFTASTVVAGNITVYAQWTGIPYTVTFNKNNADTGSTEASPQTRTVTRPATTANLPTQPARPHYNFTGWNTQANGSGTAFTASTVVTGNITVYAQWAGLSYTVAFNKNNSDSGSIEASPNTMTVTRPDTTVNLPSNPVRPYYNFTGWNTQADGSGTAFTSSAVVTENIIVYAQWSSTVTFNKNNTDTGSTEASPNTKTVILPATNLDSLPTAPSRPHYVFAGWNTQANGSGSGFTASSTVAGNITVYAQWTPNTYTVTFNKNNSDAGSTEASPQTRTVTRPTTTVSLPTSNPSRQHYTFNGWNTQADGSGTAFTASTVVTGNITVYAQWTGLSYTVTFNKNNTDTGSTEASPQTRTVTRPATTSSLPTEPTRPHYTFNGWNTQANGLGTAFTAGTTVTENITVYAQWTGVTYTVTFNKNNTDTGSTEASPNTKTVTRPTTTASLPTEPMRPHYVFNGWNTQANGSGTAFTVSTTVTANITVYAQWTANTYTVTFSKNNSDAGSTEASPQTRTVTRPVTTVNLPTTEPTRTHYTFSGWNTQADGSGTAFTSSTVVTGNITVYAKWTGVTYTVTFDKNNSDAGSTEASPQTRTVTRPATTASLPTTEPSRTHYTFSGWNTQADGLGTAFTASTTVTANITVYAQWTGVTYTVTFDKNNSDAGSTEASPQTRTVTRPTTTANLPTEPTRTHYTFSGWNTNADGSGTAFTSSTVVTGNITVYAKWTANTYTVTFSKNNSDSGSTEASPQTRTVTRPATTVNLPTTEPSRPNYSFSGWNTQANGSGSAFTASTVVTGNITVYAQWSATVTYNKNNSDADSTEASPAIKTITLPVTNVGSLPTPPTRPHYTFTGWNTQANGSGTAFTASTTVTGNITVYAQWTANTYTVTFSKNNSDAGSTEASPQTRTVTRPATTVNLPTTEPTRTHYTFSGWNTQADGLGTAFTASTVVAGNITVYAQWTGLTYTVTFNKNNTDTGSTEASPQTRNVTRPTTTIVLPTLPMRPGYTFTSWNTQTGGGGTAFTGSTEVNGNITVYAQWTANTLSISYNNGGGSGSAPSHPVSATYGTNLTMPANTYTRSGFIFTGWSVSGTGATAGFYNAGTSVAVSALSTAIANGNASITLTATWMEKIEMVPVAGGSFVMGKELGTAGSGDTTPVSTVTLSGFYIGKYQVTQEQWAAVMKGNANRISPTPSYYNGGSGREPASGEEQAKRPVESVSWYDAIVFCNRLSVMEGLSPAYSISGSTDPAAWGNVPTSGNGTWNAAIIETGSTGYRLPTEAHWEYAAKGGASQGAYTYAGSNTVGDVGWYESNNGSIPHEVGKKQANGLGLYDMSGNVWEWCWNWYGSYTGDPKADPVGASSGINRVQRGGCWLDDASALRSVSRSGDGPHMPRIFNGFRLARPQ